jgi:hypothetical protein
VLHLREALSAVPGHVPPASGPQATPAPIVAQRAVATPPAVNGLPVALARAACTVASLTGVLAGSANGP